MRTANLIVVTDDIALPLGEIRLRKKGSCGGHNGLRSIEDALLTKDYIRLRIGIGTKPDLISPIYYSTDPTVSSNDTAKFCGSCGEPLIPNALYCGNCGFKTSFSESSSDNEEMD